MCRAGIVRRRVGGLAPGLAPGVRAAAALLVALAPGVAGCSARPGSSDAGAAAPLAAGQRECPHAAASEVVSKVNAARRKADLGPLQDDRRLARAAGARAASMAARGQLSHRGWKRALRQAGVGGRVLGENVAYDYPSAAAVMQGWLASPGHRRNIMSPRFRRIGVGCVIDAEGRRWWTQSFEG